MSSRKHAGKTHSRFGSRKRKPSSCKGNIWRCLVCRLNFSGPIPLSSHLATRTHNHLALKNWHLWRSTMVELQKHLENRIQHKVSSLYCESCDVMATGVESLLQHIHSRKHTKNLHSVDHERIEQLLNEVQLRRSGIYRCQLCSQTVGDKIAFKLHNRSKNHHKALNEAFCVEKIKNLIQKQNGLKFETKAEAI